MTQSDDEVLEFLAEHELCLPPLAIAENSSVSYPTVKRRLRRLAEAGLVVRYASPQGYVEISDRGLAYLRGEQWSEKDQ